TWRPTRCGWSPRGRRQTSGTKSKSPAWTRRRFWRCMRSSRSTLCRPTVTRKCSRRSGRPPVLLLDVAQGSPEWLEARRGVPSASNFGSIVTATGKPSSTADAYAAELIDEIVRPMDERDREEQESQFRGNRHTERGHRLEPKARDWFRLVTGYDVREVGFVLNDARTLGCSPDSLIFSGNDPI